MEAKDWNWQQDEPRFFQSKTMPGLRSLVVSVFAHVVVLVMVIVFPQSTTVHIAPAKYQVVRINAGRAYLYSSSKSTKQPVRPARLNMRVRRAPAKERGPSPYGPPGQGLVEQAKQETAAITMSLKFHGIYGFYPGHQYRLAVQTAGEIPSISPAEVPLHFQQYVIVEVTIDTEGQVAQAQIVAGLVDADIQQKLLSAIREFRYTPATKDGIPIPSQRDIVIHIPS